MSPPSVTAEGHPPRPQDCSRVAPPHPHPGGSWVCAWSSPGSRGCRPRPCPRPGPPRGEPRRSPEAAAQQPEPPGSREAAVKWWRVHMCVLTHQAASRLLPGSWENASPAHALGVRFCTPPLPGAAAALSSPHPALQAVRAEQRPGWRSARPPLVPLRSPPAFSPPDAQPRDCASFLSQVLQARRAPAPPTPAAPPGPRSLRSPPDPPALTARGGALGRPRGAQQLPQPDRCLAAGGAKLHTSGSSASWGRPWPGCRSGSRRREFLTKAWLRVHSVPPPTPPFPAAPSAPVQPQPPLTALAPSLDASPWDPTRSSPHPTPVQRTWPSLRPLASSRLWSCWGQGGRCCWEVDILSLRLGKASGNQEADRVGAMGLRAPWGRFLRARAPAGCSAAPSSPFSALSPRPCAPILSLSSSSPT